VAFGAILLMSGLCGFVCGDGAPANELELQAMVAAAAARGRDGVGWHSAGSLAFAHLHLNQTPEAGNERQPEVRGALVLSASVRLDNREELFRELLISGSCRGPLKAAEVPETRGALGPASTDAELILAAYRQWGEACVGHLRGDFAFALWDDERKVLLAARDPMGLRPFYYCVHRSSLYFASEVCQILAVPRIPHRLREAALALHLASVQAPQDWTYFEGITTLPAGHALLWDRRQVRIWRHWQPRLRDDLHQLGDQELAESFFEVFQMAVRARLRSSRPVGIWLSGGLDSGSVGATAGWLKARQDGQGIPSVYTYSWRFQTLPQCDERAISDEIVQAYDLIPRYLSAEDHAPFAPQAERVTHPDEPLIQVYSPLLQAALGAARADGVGLILSGFRGDPMTESGDYDYIEALLRGHWLTIGQHLWRLKRHAPGWSVRRVLKRRFLLPPVAALRRGCWAPALLGAIQSWLPGWGAPERIQGYPAWVDAALARKIPLSDYRCQPIPAPEGIPGWAQQARYQAIFFSGFFRAAVEQERHNAALGVGYADPWSDWRLAEWVLSVSPFILSRIGEEKRISRRAMRGVMPESARLSARKIVPTPLFERTLRHDAQEQIGALFQRSALAARGYINPHQLSVRLQRLQHGPTPIDPGLWNTITAELWLRQYDYS
jgi:asparagine synthase (glutamine-hydrolysing)